MTMEVQFLRLKSGEDLIAEIEEKETTYVLNYPCKILYMKGSKPGLVSISLMQWVFSRMCDIQMFEIDKNEVLIKSWPDEGLIEHYWDSVEHFMNVDKETGVEYDKPMTEESYEETLEILKSLLDTKTDKGSLH